MEKQCAGCGKVFEDGKDPKGPVSPRPYGCCEECNGHTFRTSPENEPKEKPKAKEKPVDSEAQVS